MKIVIRPLHEAMFAGLLMVMALVVIGVIVIDDYEVVLPPGEAEDIYSGPAIRIRATRTRIGRKLDVYQPLGDIDGLYQEKSMVVVKESEDETEASAEVAEEHPQKSAAELTLTGIAWSHRNPLAFVNGEGVAVGEVIEGWKVSEITANSVMFRDDDGNHKQILLYGGGGEKLKRGKVEKLKGGKAEKLKSVGRVEGAVAY